MKKPGILWSGLLFLALASQPATAQGGPSYSGEQRATSFTQSSEAIPKTTPPNQTPPSASSQDSLPLITDPLSADYLREAADRDNVVRLRPESRHHGRFQVRRTLVPLNHFGGNVFAPLLNDPLLLEEIRQAKRNPNWHPFQPGQTPSSSSPFHYDQNGMTQPSQAATLDLFGRIKPKSMRYFFGLHFNERWGPFPNQHETTLDGLLRLSARLRPDVNLTAKLLMRDNGWFFNRVDEDQTNQWGNTVYTDRTRFALESLNAWRGWAWGWSVGILKTVKPTRIFELYIEQYRQRWQSRFKDNHKTPLPHPQQISRIPVIAGVFPAFAPQGFGERTDQITTLTLNLHTQTTGTHRFRLGGEFRFHNLEKTTFESDGSLISSTPVTSLADPWEQALYAEDQLRFWGRLVVELSLRIDRYDPNGTRLLDLYQISGDRFSLAPTIREGLGQAEFSPEARWRFSPRFKASYPFWGFLGTHLAFGTAYHRPTLESRYLDQSLGPASGYALRESISLHPQRTRFAEVGLQRQGEHYGAQVIAFYRDMDQFTVRPGPEVLPNTGSYFPGYWGPVNAGFQEAYGLEVHLTRRLAPLPKTPVTLAARLSYTTLFDFEDHLRPEDPFRYGRLETPGDLTAFQRRLDLLWDRSHWLAFALSMNLPKRFTFSLTSRSWSGPRYISPGESRQVSFGTIESIAAPGEESIQRKTVVRTGPWTYLTDVRLEGGVPLAGKGPEVFAFVEVRNLLNRANIHVIPHPRAYEGLDHTAPGQPDLPELNRAQEIYGPARSFWIGLDVRW